MRSFGKGSKKTMHVLEVNLTFSFRKTIRDFGHLFQTFQIIHCTGLVLQNDLMLRFTKFKSWQHFYLTKHTNIDTETMEEITNEYRHAKKVLALFRDDFNSSILIEVASKMLWILGKTPKKTIQSSFFFLSHLLLSRFLSISRRLLLYP
jgi:hypothetical protein